VVVAEPVDVALLVRLRSVAESVPVALPVAVPESVSVRSELLTATLKLFFARPPEVRRMMGRLFKSSLADGVTQMTVGGGFRSRLAKNIDVGVAYEKAIISPEGLTDDRFTFGVIVRF
jgi:hypothetical protein